MDLHVIYSFMQLFLRPAVAAHVRMGRPAQTSLWVLSPVPVQTTSLGPTVIQVHTLDTVTAVSDTRNPCMSSDPLQSLTAQNITFINKDINGSIDNKLYIAKVSNRNSISIYNLNYHWLLTNATQDMSVNDYSFIIRNYG